MEKKADPCATGRGDVGRVWWSVCLDDAGDGTVPVLGQIRPAASTLSVGSAPLHVMSAVGP